jgi:hypothetical protein
MISWISPAIFVKILKLFFTSVTKEILIAVWLLPILFNFAARAMETFYFDRYFAHNSKVSCFSIARFLPLFQHTFCTTTKTFTEFSKNRVIVLQNLWGNIELSNNNITNEDSHVNVQFIGAHLLNCPNATIYNNSVNGVTTAIANPNDGFVLSESFNANIYGNCFNNLRAGLNFIGPTNDHTIVKSNTLQDLANTIRINPGGIIGQQVHRGNAFTSSTNKTAQFIFNAPNSGVTYNYSPFDDISILMSSFTIQATKVSSSIFRPSPVQIDDKIDNNVWFQFKTGNQVFPISCYQTGPPIKEQLLLSKGDELYLSNQFPAYLGFPASTWEAGFRLFGTLDNTPNLRPVGSAAATFFNNNYNSTTGKLYRAYEDIASLGLPNTPADSTQLQNYYTTIDIKIKTILVKDSLIGITTDATQLAQLKQERTNLNADLDNTFSSLSTVLTALKSNAVSKANSILSDLNSISASTVFEQNLKTILSIQVNQFLNGTAFSDTQIATINGIGQQCRFEGGFGVVLARLMIPNTTNDDNICIPKNRNESQITSSNLDNFINIYPNPTIDYLQIDFQKPVKNGTFTIRNAIGKVIYAQAIEGESIILSNFDFSNGLYIAELKIDGFRTINRKFIVSK